MSQPVSALELGFTPDELEHDLLTLASLHTQVEQAQMADGAAALKRGGMVLGGIFVGAAATGLLPLGVAVASGGCAAVSFGAALFGMRALRQELAQAGGTPRTVQDAARRSLERQIRTLKFVPALPLAASLMLTLAAMTSAAGLSVLVAAGLCAGLAGTSVAVRNHALPKAQQRLRLLAPAR